MLLWEKVVASRVPRMARVQGHSNYLSLTPSHPHPLTSHIWSLPSWVGRTLGSASMTQNQTSGPQLAAQVTYSSVKLLAGKYQSSLKGLTLYFSLIQYSVNFSLPWLC